MMTLIIAAAAAAQTPAATTPAPATPATQHAQHQGKAAGEHKGMDCCKDCCKDMAVKHKGQRAEHEGHSGH
jgi:hypothetical protein